LGVLRDLVEVGADGPTRPRRGERVARAAAVVGERLLPGSAGGASSARRGRSGRRRGRRPRRPPFPPAPPPRRARCGAVGVGSGDEILRHRRALDAVVAGVLDLVADDLANGRLLEALPAGGTERVVEVRPDRAGGARVAERVARTALLREEPLARGRVAA